MIAAALAGFDASNAAFPFMAAAAMELDGIPGRIFRISFSGELAYEVAVPARHATRAWQALLRAGEPCGLRPYGLDALNTLRIEKGHITGAELNGNTSASDLGFGRMLKKSGDFVGRVLSRRAAISSPQRLQLVGIRALDPGRRLRNGMHLVEPAAPAASLGYITSSTPATEHGGWLGLALLANGTARIDSPALALCVRSRMRAAARHSCGRNARRPLHPRAGRPPRSPPPPRPPRRLRRPQWSD